jgi:hypothetical protein
MQSFLAAMQGGAGDRQSAEPEPASTLLDSAATDRPESGAPEEKPVSSQQVAASLAGTVTGTNKQAAQKRQLAASNGEAEMRLKESAKALCSGVSGDTQASDTRAELAARKEKQAVGRGLVQGQEGVNSAGISAGTAIDVRGSSEPSPELMRGAWSAASASLSPAADGGAGKPAASGAGGTAHPAAASAEDGMLAASVNFGDGPDRGVGASRTGALGTSNVDAHAQAKQAGMGTLRSLAEPAGATGVSAQANRREPGSVGERSAAERIDTEASAVPVGTALAPSAGGGEARSPAGQAGIRVRSSAAADGRAGKNEVTGGSPTSAAVQESVATFPVAGGVLSDAFATGAPIPGAGLAGDRSGETGGASKDQSAGAARARRSSAAISSNAPAQPAAVAASSRPALAASSSHRTATANAAEKVTAKSDADSTALPQRMAHGSTQQVTLPHAADRVAGAPGSSSSSGANAAQTTPQSVLASAAGGAHRTTSASTGASGQREVFSVMDADSTSVKTTWVHAGAQHAEAGYQDATLGWVGVRAETGSGGIHAALVPGSADAARALGGHLDGLNAYLADHHTGVDKVTLAAPTGHDAGSTSAGNSNQGAQQGTGQGEGQGGSRDQPMDRRADGAATSMANAGGARAREAGTDAGLDGVPARAGHISVLA